MDLDAIKQRMHKALEVLKNDLGTIRTGRATPALVENISVSVYGGSTHLKVMELATIGAPDIHTLLLTPFDPSIIGEIAKGIQEANVGLSPSVDGQIIRISIPPLSEERRAEFVKLMHQKIEQGRINIRQVRQDAMSDIKKIEGVSEDEQKRLEKLVQEETDKLMKEIDVAKDKKETELMQL